MSGWSSCLRPDRVYSARRLRPCNNLPPRAKAKPCGSAAPNWVPPFDQLRRWSGGRRDSACCAFEVDRRGPLAGSTGGVAEWLKAHAWKACLRETVTWVRIPLPPPLSMGTHSLARRGRRSLRWIGAVKPGTSAPSKPLFAGWSF